MKTRLIISSLIVMFGFIIPNIGLGQCGTVSSGKNKPIMTSGSRDGARSSYTFNVFIHIITKDNGNGGMPLTDVQNAIADASTFFDSGNICFKIIGNDKIKETIYANNYNDVFFDDLVSTNAHNDAIDVYVIPNQTNFYEYLGKTKVLSTGLLVIGNAINNGTTLPHELGHCLGLYHLNEDASGCAEFVDGSNCLNCGDQICDTPAQPDLIDASDILNCNYIGIQIDANGDTYTPEITNMMGTFNKECRDHFTSGQFESMYTTIDDNQILLNALEPQIKTIQNLVFPYYIFNIIPINDYTYGASVSIFANNLTLEPDAIISFVAGENIVLSPTVHIEPGAQFHAFIENPRCDLITQGAELKTVTTVTAETLAIHMEQENQNKQFTNVETNLEIDVKVSPNPFMHYTELKIENPAFCRHTVDIIDPNGVILKTFEPNPKEGTTTVRVIGDDMKSGCYFYRIISEKSIKTGKIIKL